MTLLLLQPHVLQRACNVQRLSTMLLSAYVMLLLTLLSLLLPLLLFLLLQLLVLG
jgi:hypothetical protein